MKNIKDITISIFAVIGFVAIITAFTNQPEQTNQTTTPESHIYEMYDSDGTAFKLNKVTGEVTVVTYGTIRKVSVYERIPTVVDNNW